LLFSIGESGKGSGLSFQELPGFGLVTATTTVIADPEDGNHYAPGTSLLGNVDSHKPGMAPLLLNECGNPIDFSPLDYAADGGNMVLWDNVKGGFYPWDSRYYEENPDTSDGFDPTYIMQHATDSASTAGCLATGHKAAVGMMSLDLYEEKVSTLVEDAQFCGKAGGSMSSVTILHATPGAFIAHAASRRDTETLQKSFQEVNPTFASGACAGDDWPQSSYESMVSGAMSSEWTVLTQSPDVMAEVSLSWCFKNVGETKSHSNFTSTGLLQQYW
jgi:alkaline phosphatase